MTNGKLVVEEIKEDDCDGQKNAAQKLETAVRTPLGNGLWGHSDLAGSMWEWVFDWYYPWWYAEGGSMCDNCANLVPGSGRTRRGGCGNSAGFLRAAFRAGNSPTDRFIDLSLRCVVNR